MRHNQLRSDLSVGHAVADEFDHVTSGRVRRVPNPMSVVVAFGTGAWIRREHRARGTLASAEVLSTQLALGELHASTVGYSSDCVVVRCCVVIDRVTMA